MRDPIVPLRENTRLPSHSLPHEVENLLCEALRGEAALWPWAREAHWQDFRRAVDLHGLAGLLHTRPAVRQWPTPARQYLREQATRHAMWELAHQHMLTQVLGALAEEGVEPILFKGTALAYSLYSEASQRIRSDTDLIVPSEAVEKVRLVLESQGFEPGVAMAGDFISYQSSHFRRGADGASHALDLHWRINNSELLAQLFSYQELRRAAVPLPALGPHALAAQPVHAMLLACMHRLTHKHNPYYVQGEAHYSADRLIWLLDIHLIADAFSAADWTQLLQLASDKGLRAVCADGMRRAQECFHTPCPEGVLAALDRPGSSAEPVAIYFQAGPLRQRWMDFQALGSFTRRALFLRELFFPSPDYMRARFQNRSTWMLPWLYLRRSATGAARRLARIVSG